MSNLFLLTLKIEKMLNSPVEVGTSSSVPNNEDDYSADSNYRDKTHIT